MIGKAAHIHAAAPGGKRYLTSMTPEQRSDISNAIWLCANHADLIDRDEMTYTAQVLQVIKREHEAACAERQLNTTRAGAEVLDLIAIGPDVIFTGDFLGLDNSTWSFHLRNFVEGDINTLITFIERYPLTSAIDRYVLVNFLGDGRVIKNAPSLSSDKASGYIVRCPVLPSAGRIFAADLPVDLALSEDHDLMLEDGDIATVSGKDALPQRLKVCLSHQKGENLFNRDFGTRFAEYYRLLSGSPWFEHFLKLEVIRQASIPYFDALSNSRDTPLLCIERVFGVELLADSPTNNWLPIRLDIEVKGIGRSKYDLSVCIPAPPVARSSMD